MKNFNIQVIIVGTMAIFSKFNFLSKMNECKNYAKLIICAFAIFGMTACEAVRKVFF